ncbi:MAG: response regulator [Acidobacteria bacterium]|nr:response regulator [Acidobacteriota bacterium]
MNRKKIVIAEDDPVMRRILTHTVESMGFMAINCTNGAIALDLLKAKPDIALLVTDVAMPSMDGDQLVQAVRALDERADLPIIIISAVVKAKQIEHLLDLGVSRFLPKPVNVSHLRDYITQLIGQREQVLVS